MRWIVVFETDAGLVAIRGNSLKKMLSLARRKGKLIASFSI